MKNIDKIRAMSIDDMAAFLSRFCVACEDGSACPLASSDCPTSKHIEAGKMWEMWVARIEAWKMWLEREVEQ